MPSERAFTKSGESVKPADAPLNTADETGSDSDQLCQLYRFRHVHLIAGSQGLHPIFNARVGSQSNCGKLPAFVRRQSADSLDQFITVLTRHANVAN